MRNASQGVEKPDPAPAIPLWLANLPNLCLLLLNPPYLPAWKALPRYLLNRCSARICAPATLSNAIVLKKYVVRFDLMSRHDLMAARLHFLSPLSGPIPEWWPEP